MLLRLVRLLRAGRKLPRRLALEERLELAAIEWQEERARLTSVLCLLAVAVCLGIVALMTLTLAVVSSCWDTPWRMTAVWGMVILWLVCLVACVARLLLIAARRGEAFALTRRELERDWQAFRGEP